MIRHLSITGLGPWTSYEVELDPSGVTTISGPSESGKSTLIRAATLALLGVDVDGTALDVRAIRPEASKAEVEIVTAKGTRVFRSLSMSRSQVRRVTKPGADAEGFSTEDAFAGALGAVATKKLGATGRQVHAARLVLAPLSWVPLAQESAGRPLRDVLSQLVPGDLRAEVARLMDGALEDRDPTDEKAAVEERRKANAARDEAAGALREAKAQLEGLAEPAPKVDVGDQVRLVERGRTWQAYDAELSAWRKRREAAAQRAEKIAALGPEPKRPATLAEPRDVREALAKANADIVRLSATPGTPQAVAALRQDLAARRSELRALEGEGSACPTCHRDGWAGKVAAIEAVSLAVRGLEEQLEIAEADASDANGRRERDLASATKRRDELARKLQEYESAAARWSVDAAAWQAWQQASTAIGPEVAVGPEPERPRSARPSDDEVALAEAALVTAEKREGEWLAHRRAQETAKGRVEQAISRLEGADARAKRLDRLVAAIRKAPGERARRMAEVLGNLGPVELAITDAGVEVLVDGRPWWLASRGRLVSADAWLRAGLRRALGMTWCPIFVDDAASWTGGWPAWDGPVVMLRTEPGEFRVSTARRAA